jgi:iron complex outermembrane recepter protein
VALVVDSGDQVDSVAEEVLVDLAEVVDSVQAVEVQVVDGKSLKLLFCLILGIPTIGQAQNNSPADTLRATLEPVFVTVNRNYALDQQTPFSVSTQSRSELLRVSSTITGTESLMAMIPGVFVSNRENYSLGERLSIRGSGWRASFGVRGVQVLIDGLPLTSPDGQTILELVDPNLIRETQVIRGPSALFWGNGSGGTVYFKTESRSDDPTVSVRSSAGSYGLLQNDLTLRTSLKKSTIQLSLSDFRTDGYRDHSKAHLSRLNLSVTYPLSDQKTLRYQAFGITAPDIRNPGSLTLSGFNENPKAANPQFITQRAGKSYNHLIHGLTYSQQHGETKIESVLYNTFRSLQNPITPSIIEINRLNVGTRNSISRTFESFQVSFSADAAYQSDIRKNWRNTRGDKGQLTTDQVEDVGSVGFALLGQYTLNNWTISAGVRSDQLYFQATDRLPGEGNASGSRWMTAFTPQLGVTYQTSIGTFYSGMTSSFESPTTTELVNRPDLSRGFNPDLDPERSTGLELGFRSRLLAESILLETAIYRVNVRDRLRSYQTQAGGDRTFFENIGSTRQQGFEFHMEFNPFDQTRFGISYTFSDFIFSDKNQPNYDNVLPGIPEHSLKAQLMQQIRGFSLGTDATFNTGMYANDANSQQTQDYLLINATVSKVIHIGKKHSIIPFFTLRNITSVAYSPSVSINAFGSRFYEPGLPRNFVLGISVLFN